MRVVTAIDGTCDTYFPNKEKAAIFDLMQFSFKSENMSHSFSFALEA